MRERIEGSARARRAWKYFRIVPLLLALVAGTAQADELDFVLERMHEAGVIDGNVVAAKKLIACMADGGTVDGCATGTGDAELAADPQVRNVIDIYTSFRDHDWYAVVKKAGVTIGCALVPGGEVKDIACGELGKIAMEVADGVGSVLGAVGNFVNSLFGSDDPPAMPEEDYYRLNFEPWLHRSVIAQLDQDTPANLQVLGAPMPACLDYFLHHGYSGPQAGNACTNMRARLENTGLQVGNAFRQETDSYFQMHFAPKVEEWAAMSFGNQNLGIYAKQAVNTCVDDERKHVPLPPPGYEQCAAIEKEILGFGNGILGDQAQQLAAQAKAQCMAQAQARATDPGNDAYTRTCGPIGNQVTLKVLAAMKEIKDRMDLAVTAGCVHNGTPKSVRCGSIPAQAACQKALPEHASMCALDPVLLVQFELNYIYSSVDAPDARCKVVGPPNWTTIQCPHTLQVFRCNGLKKAIADEQGAQAVGDIACETRPDAAYDAKREVAAQVVAALNADYGSGTPPQPCETERHDPLAILCPAGFQWNADGARGAAVGALIGEYVACPPDDDNDGAESARLQPSSGPVLTPLTPVLTPIRQRPKLVPAPQGNGG